ASKEEMDRYQKAKEALVAKQNEADDFQDQQVDEYLRKLLPRTAEYMVAARRVYRDKADAAAVSREKGLSLEALRKWAAFLEPTAEARPYLDEWTAASEDSVGAVAVAFQQRVEQGYAQ